MRNEKLPQDVPGYKAIGFSTRLQKLMAAKADRYVCHDANDDELASFVSAAREAVPGLAGDDVLRRLREKNRQIFQVVQDTTTGRAVGFTAQIPLTPEGLGAVLDGTFAPSSPDLDHLARSGDAVDAIYSWLIYSPSSFVAVTAALGRYVEQVAPNGASIFCRAANDKAVRAFAASGYEPASLTYPGAPADLLVVHAQARTVRERAKPTIEISLVSNWEEMAQVSSIRAATYMSDQHCPYKEEFDGNDFCSAHLLGKIDGEPAGCIRIRFFGEFVKIERLAVRKEFRTSRLAFRLARSAIDYAAAKGFQRMYGHARKDLVRFWKSFGFQVMEGRAPFSFSDVEFVEMAGEIPSSQTSLTLQASPLVLIRPEGAWDKPGPLERTQNLQKMSQISQNLRHRTPIGQDEKRN